jgi:hypothetical protein
MFSWRGRSLVTRLGLTVAIAALAAPAANAKVIAGYSDVPSHLRGKPVFIAGYSDVPSQFRGKAAFVPGVTDFPSRLVGEPRSEFIPGVTDVPSRIVGAQNVAKGEYGMPRAMPSDYATAGVALDGETARATGRGQRPLAPRGGNAVVASSDRFDWADAGIGAGVGGAVLLLAAAAALAARQQRERLVQA